MMIFAPHETPASSAARSRPHRWFSVLAVTLAVAGLSLTACSGRSEPDSPTAPPPDTPKPHSAVSVPTEIIVGQSIVFPCENPTIEPPPGGRAVGDAVVIRKPGKYTWQCTDLPPGSFTATPGDPVGVAWSPDLQKAVILGRSMLLRAWKVDAQGHEVETLTLRASPPDAVVFEGERLRFIGAGEVRIEALDKLGAKVAEQNIRVDSGPPTVRVLTPKRGDIVSSAAQDWVILQGHVEEDGPIVHLSINGQVVIPDRNGVFEFSIKPERPGLQVLSYRASDELSQISTGTHAVLFGEVRPIGRLIHHASRVYLPAAFLDDNDPLLNDLARASEVMLSGLTIPNTSLSLGCGGHLYLSDIKWKPAQVNIQPLAQQLKIGIELQDLSVQVSGEACLCAWGSSMGCASFDGSVATSLISASATVALGAASPTSIELTDIQMSIDPLRIHWNVWSGSLDWFVELFESSVRDFLKDTVKNALSSRVRSDLASLLDQIMPSQRLTLPPPIDAFIDIKTHLERLVVSPAGLRLDFGFSIDNPAPSGSAPASTLKVSSAPPMLPPDHLGVAVSLDALNEALFVLFQRDAFADVVLEWRSLGLQPPPGLGTVRLSASLPPILMPGQNAGELELAVGDLKIEANTTLGPIYVFVSFIMPVRLQYSEKDSSVLLTFLSDGFLLHFAPASKDDAQTLSASLLDLEAIARNAIVSFLSARQIRLAVPVIDLSQIKTIPAFKGQQIGLKDASLSITPSGYITLSTQVESQSTP